MMDMVSEDMLGKQVIVYLKSGFMKEVPVDGELRAYDRTKIHLLKWDRVYLYEFEKIDSITLANGKTVTLFDHIEAFKE